MCAVVRTGTFRMDFHQGRKSMFKYGGGGIKLRTNIHPDCGIIFLNGAINLVRFGVYLDQILTLKNFKNYHFLCENFNYFHFLYKYLKNNHFYMKIKKITLFHIKSKYFRYTLAIG